MNGFPQGLGREMALALHREGSANLPAYLQWTVSFRPGSAPGGFVFPNSTSVRGWAGPPSSASPALLLAAASRGCHELSVR
jgi:hypothetical protein